MRRSAVMRFGRGRQLVVSAALAVISLASAAHAVGPGGAPAVGGDQMAGPQWLNNLLLGDRSTFDKSAGGWVGNPQTTTRRVVYPRQAGTGSLAIINASTGVGTSWVSSGNSPSTYFPAVPGARYALNFWALASANARGIAGQIAFLDANGHEFERATGMKNMDSTKTWLRVTDTVAIAPPTAKYVVARVMVFGVVPGETHLIDTVTLKRANGGAANVAGPLHTSGAQILDSNGRAVHLRGFVRVGMQTGPSAPTVTADDISHAKAWGANVIRLPLGSQLWLDPSFNTCHTDPSYVSKVDYAVNLITGMGMYVLLDLHWNDAVPCGPAKTQAMADYPNSVSFWQQVAARYKDNPLVGFDLYNEPHNISDTVWRYGGKVTYNNVTFQAAGMEQMYQAVRGTGATNLVFVTGNVWGNTFPSTAPLPGSNIVYSAHAYTCPGYAPPKCTSTTPYDGSTILKNWADAGTRVPVFVGEFGWPSPGSGRYADSVIDYAEAHGWGWTLFTWGNNTKSRFTLISEGWGTAYEPAPSGMPALETFAGA